MNTSVSFCAPSVLTETHAARVSIADPCGRLSLRTRADLSAFTSVLGCALPERVGERAASGATEVICLGPDEWMIHAPQAQIAGIEAACAAFYDSIPHSLVDVSGRETTFEVNGPRAAELLTLGCPRDLDRLKPGEGRRTVFDGTTVILWRDADTSFRLDVWHSFAPYLFHMLDTGCRELAAETR